MRHTFTFPGFKDEHAGPPDPDVTLLNDYLLDQLSRKRRAEFERRLDEDAAFYLKIEPLIEIYRRQNDWDEAMAAIEEDEADDQRQGLLA